MIEWLQKILLGHNHKWEIVKTLNIKYWGRGAVALEIVVLKCSVCGKLKNHKITWS